MIFWITRMMKMKLMNKAYWERRYIEGSDFWNAKGITTPIKEYLNQLTDKHIRILIPGLGHGYELMYLKEQGFANVVGLDLTDLAARETLEKFPLFPIDEVVLGDFFQHEGQYDLILEHTFFCSLPIALRPKYVAKMKELLAVNGRLVGVLFDCEFDSVDPPFGGSLSEYKKLFCVSDLNIEILEPCYNSIKPRKDREVFIKIVKQQHD
ncbi:SAM-dependent methyltransferase [Myroides sp. BIT-d1]|uniref:SAM-dependent methyltransferase n=2 Tax=Myroides albus TaxID=2562892 RepID=A0A6I3LN51_9FLAO|nr:SAM-dependent methyltransferase [Myroides albus]